MTPTDKDPMRLTPLLDPILALLRSRKVIIAAATALVDTLIIAVPSLLPVRDQLLAVITTLALALIGTTTAEDMGKVHEAAKVQVAAHQANAAVLSAQVVANKRGALSGEESAPSSSAVSVGDSNPMTGFTPKAASPPVSTPEQ